MSVLHTNTARPSHPTLDSATHSFVCEIRPDHGIYTIRDNQPTMSRQLRYGGTATNAMTNEAGRRQYRGAAGPLNYTAVYAQANESARLDHEATTGAVNTGTTEGPQEDTAALDASTSEVNATEAPVPVPDAQPPTSLVSNFCQAIVRTFDRLLRALK